MTKYIFIDTETTGVNPKENGIIQLAGLIAFEENGTYAEMERFNYFIRPLEQNKIESRALEVNNLTTEQLMHFPEAIDVYMDFIRTMGKYIDKYNRNDKFQFVAYNARFDFDFIREWFANLGDVYFGSWFHFPPLDVMNMAAFLLNDQRKNLANFKLETVANYLGLAPEGQLHDAYTDIILTKNIYDYFIKVIK